MLEINVKALNPSLLKRPRYNRAAAFTLIELLVVLVVLCLLGVTLVPTLAGSRIGSQAFRCVNNNRQLCSAWRMYADDNRDTLVYSSDDGTGARNPLNQYAWTWTHMDYSTSAYNWDPNVDIVKRPLWPYTAHDPSIFRCPSDSSFVVVNRVMKPRVRSFSMNLFVGGFPAPVSFPSVSSYRVFSKTTDFTVMPPTKAFVFLDERPDVIIWGNFLVNMTGYPKNPAQYELYQDLPGFFHNFGSSFSFADGRAEIHRWTDPRTVPPLRSTGASTIDTIAVPRDADVAWLQDHATRPK